MQIVVVLEGLAVQLVDLAPLLVDVVARLLPPLEVAFAALLEPDRALGELLHRCGWCGCSSCSSGRVLRDDWDVHAGALASDASRHGVHGFERERMCITAGVTSNQNRLRYHKISY